METLLREKDNKFYKVPLNNYSQFMFLKFKISGRKCQLSKLPNFIQCENIKFLSEIKKIINNPGYKQKKAVVIYFNEFDKNYSNARLKPKTEKYNDKKKKKNTIVDDLKTYVNLWNKKYYHPYVSDEILQTLKGLLNQIEPIMREIKTLIATEYQVRKHEIDEIQNSDIIKQSIMEIV